jgi:hypothetical protein
MAVDKARISLVFILLVLLLSILALVYWDFIRDTIIIPIYYIIWVIGLFLKSIPQGVYFATLVFISLYIGFKTLESVQGERSTKRLEKDRPESGTQYQRWKSLYTNIDINPFARHRFVWEARKLILSILAYEQGINSAEAETLVPNGTVAVPEPIRNLIEEKKIPGSRPPINRIAHAVFWLRRLLFKVDTENDLQIDPLVGEIISFIEHRLEINHAGSHPESWN